MGSPWAGKCCLLPEGLVFSFLATPLQPQNGQIMSELECCKNVHIRNVDLDIENIHLARASSLVEDLGNPVLCQRKSFACLAPASWGRQLVVNFSFGSAHPAERSAHCAADPPPKQAASVFLQPEAGWPVWEPVGKAPLCWAALHTAREFHSL